MIARKVPDNFYFIFHSVLDNDYFYNFYKSEVIVCNFGVKQAVSRLHTKPIEFSSLNKITYWCDNKNGIRITVIAGQDLFLENLSHKKGKRRFLNVRVNAFVLSSA